MSKVSSHGRRKRLSYAGRREIDEAFIARRRRAMARSSFISAEDAKLIEQSFREYWTRDADWADAGWFRRRSAVRRPLSAWKYVKYPVLTRHIPRMLIPSFPQSMPG